MNNEKFNKLNNIGENKVLNLYNFLNRKELFELAKRMDIHNLQIQREGELLKFRRWEPNWELPQETQIKEERINYKSSRRNQNIIKRTVWAKIEKSEDFKKRWSSAIPPKYWGNQAKIPYQIVDGWVWCKIHDNWVFDIGLKESFVYHKKWLYYKIPQKKIAISYISKDKQTNFILLPLKIQTNLNFYEGLGLQQGDGTHSLGDVHITFTNSCIDLIIHQIKWFEMLGISKNVLRIVPEIPSSADNTEGLGILLNRLKEKGINNQQIRNLKINRNSINPNIQIIFHNKLFKLFYLYLLYNSRSIILKNKKAIIGYLRGVFASEGSVKVRKESGLFSAIKISASPKETRNFYKKCLIGAGIIPSKDEMTQGSEAVIISRLENYKKILEMSLLGLHPKKQERFIKVLGNYQNVGGTGNG